MEHLIRFVVSGELAKCQLCVVRERVALLYRVSGNARLPGYGFKKIENL
jgi:hypothetical protein